MLKNIPNYYTKPMSWAGNWLVPDSMTTETIFLTVAEPAELAAARLMIASLRTFGGELAQAPVWVFSSSPAEIASLQDSATHLLYLAPFPQTPCLFAEKVTACAQAETLAPPGTRSLVWMDPACLVLQPPLHFSLASHFDAALRPVHVRNVGLPAGAAPDAFWQGIFARLGVADLPATVTSFVDDQVLRSYFNSHAFAINPALGLMSAWREHFLMLNASPSYLTEACPDPLHRIFLFQALFSALLASAIAPDRVNLLPPTYNYPCHLQQRIPPERRTSLLNDLVCCAYEDLSPANLPGFEIREPLRTWLNTHANR